MTKLYLDLMNRVNRDEEGQGLVEYALVIAVIAVLIVAALGGLRTAIEGAFTDIAASL